MNQSSIKSLGFVENVPKETIYELIHKLEKQKKITIDRQVFEILNSREFSSGRRREQSTFEICSGTTKSLCHKTPKVNDGISFTDFFSSLLFIGDFDKILPEVGLRFLLLNAYKIEFNNINVAMFFKYGQAEKRYSLWSFSRDKNEIMIGVFNCYEQVCFDPDMNWIVAKTNGTNGAKK